MVVTCTCNADSTVFGIIKNDDVVFAYDHFTLQGLETDDERK